MLINDVIGDGAERRLKKQVLATLPDKGNDIEPAITIQRLSQLERNKTYAYAPRNVQKKINLVHRYVTRLADRTAMTFDADATNDDLVGVAINQFQYYVRHPPAGHSTAHDGEVTYGAAALINMWRVLATVDMEAVAFEQLQIFDTYEWLVPADIKKEVNAMIQDKAKDIESKLSRMQTLAAHAVAKQAARSKQGGRGAAADKDNVKAAMADFGL